MEKIRREDPGAERTDPGRSDRSLAPDLTELVTTLKLNREDREDREGNIFCGLRGYRFCQIMRWIPSLMRVTFS
jgi:hypothetical protein